MSFFLTGLEREGIFRKSPSNAALSVARNKLDQRMFSKVHTLSFTDKLPIIDINKDNQKLDVYTSTSSLIKMFLAGLPKPILSTEFAETHGNTRDTNEMKAQIIKYYRDRPYHYALLKYLIDFLAQVAANSETNKMDVHNFAVVFAPSLIRSTVPHDNILTNSTDAALYLIQVKQHMSLIEFLIDQRENIF